MARSPGNNDNSGDHINSQQPTTYDTTSLTPNNDDTLTAPQRRRQVVRWGATALTVGVGLALVGYGFSGHHSPASAVSVNTASVPSVGVVPTPTQGASIQCWQSSYLKNVTKMMEPITGLSWAKKTGDATSSVIRVDGSQKFQEIFGFGGAFTEAASLQFKKLPQEKQEEVLKLYFDKEHGSGYEFGRVPMGSSDFSTASYSFANVIDDFALAHFDDNVTQDTKYIIPFIKRAKEKNPNLKLILAPWSPPAWMKQTDDQYTVSSMLGSAKPNGLRKDVREPWANYFSKFISAYKKHGLPFWGLSPQNEPEYAAQWEACVYNTSSEAEFVAEFLGPVIKHDHPEVKIMMFDHNRDSVLHWAETILKHEKAAQYIDGIAIHWYDNERYMDGVEFHEHVNDTHYVDETKFIMSTESSSCPGVATGDEAWFRAQRYAHDIITEFNNWVVGWVDWNLLLDHTGGPNHLGNHCDAAIIIDETEKDYFIQPMYYFIQHFSKFVPPGSRRIHTQVSVRFDKPGDAQLYVLYPAAIHVCDGSARQAIRVTEDSKLQVIGTNFCIDLLRPQSIDRQVVLVDCRYTSQTWTFVNDSIRMDDHCLQLYNGSPLDGARVTVGQCHDNEKDLTVNTDFRKWKFHNGQMQSLAAPDKCVTAGYAFVQSASFITPANKKVVVVLNENTEDAAFELQYEDQTVVTTVPRGAIRTFTWE
jgi:glucosylceramidase